LTILGFFELFIPWNEMAYGAYAEEETGKAYCSQR
jgi:hypothetical protein